MDDHEKRRLIQRGKKLLKENPALWDVNWLPALPLCEGLDDVRDRHISLLGELTALSQESIALRTKYDEEDKAREQAYQDGQPAPKRTSDTDREAATKERSARSDALHASLAECVAEAVTLIQDSRDEWEAELNKLMHEAEEKKAQAAALVDEATALIWTSERSGMWFKRTAKDQHMMHIQWNGMAGVLPNPHGDTSKDVEHLLEKMLGRA